MGESSRALRQELADLASRSQNTSRGGDRDREDNHNGGTDNSSSSSGDDDEWFQAKTPRFSRLPRAEDCRLLPFEPGNDDDIDEIGPADGNTVSLKKPWSGLKRQIRKVEWIESRGLYLYEGFPQWVWAGGPDALPTIDEVISNSNFDPKIKSYKIKKAGHEPRVLHFSGNYRPRFKDPMVEISEVSSKLYRICALCGPRAAFTSPQLLKSHLVTVHMKSIKREVEILGSCLKCERSNSNIQDFAMHLSWCYDLKGYKVESDKSDLNLTWNQDWQKEFEATKAGRGIYDKRASTPTQHALNELAKYIQENPDAVKIALEGKKLARQSKNGIPESAATTRCEISCPDLRYCLDSSVGDVVKLTKKLTVCVFGSKVGRVVNPYPAFEKEINCIIGFILKHFGSQRDEDGGGGVTDQGLRDIVAEVFRIGRKRSHEKFVGTGNKN